MRTKHCSKCDQTKPLEDFTKSQKASTNFRASSNAHHSYCKLCNAQLAREWRKNNPNYRGSGVLKKYSMEDRGIRSAIRARLADAKSRAKKSGKLDLLNITVDSLFELFKKQQGKCALTGCDLAIEQNHHRSLSIDKIIPEQGYHIENVQWTCWAANRAKGDMQTDVFIDMCKHVLEHQKVQRLSKSSEN